MSFRNRLGLFFVVIVIVPMLAVAFLLFDLIGDSVSGRAKARVDARHNAATQLYVRDRQRASVALDDVGSDARLQELLLAGRKKAAAERAKHLIEAQAIERIVLVRGDSVRFSRGDRTAIAPASRPVISRTRGRTRNFGRLQVSVVDAARFARETKAITRQDVVVRDRGAVIASTLPMAAARRLPASGETTIGDDRYLAETFTDRNGFARQQLRVTTLGTIATAGGTVTDERLKAGGILLGFFVLAIACAILVSRSLQQQIAGFLAAARRLAAGDFTAKVPTGGRDEFAALGDEFNKMSGELERRLAQLTQERGRVQDSMRRLGEAVASNLDRDALLELVVRTAVDGVGADAGRACVRTLGLTTLQERSRVGNMNGLEAAVEAVEAEALRTGSPREASVGDTSAIAHPLRGADDHDVVGVVSVGRAGRPFTPQDRDLFSYLAGQAARSLENVQLHETAARESVTDELTGLSNRRAFDDALAGEVERARRFGTPLGLVLLDLDNFKQINDGYGHQQGDVVLHEVARVVRDTSREIDHPARYGGEELAVVLPSTDLLGAFNFAERLRERIAGLRIARLDGGGTIGITTSCGVAAAPPVAADARALVASADAALYEAKRDGKNMSVRAR